MTESHAYSGQPTRNPFRYGLAVWRLIRNDPSETTPEAAIVEMGFARSKLGRRFARWEELVEALKRDPRTAEALRERRVFGRIELAGLAGLPVGSLGRSFADHCSTRDLDPNLIHVPPDDEVGWVLNHLYQTHDIWHVITGFDNDLPGEVGLGNFYSGQFGSPAFFGFMLALILGNVVWRRAALDPVMRATAHGYQAGQKAEPLFGVHWDEMWEVPLEEIRSRFGVEIPMLGVLLMMALLIGGLATGQISAWWASPVLGVAYYAIFTVLHESMHGLAHRNRAVNRVLGRVAGFALMLPPPMFRAAHLAHHAHTNDPAQDPDLMVMRRSAWFRPVWFLLTPFHYRRMVYSGGLLRGKQDRIEAITTEVSIVALIIAAIATGNGTLLLQAWVLPAMLAILFLALAFDLLPHYPHTSQERYYDTRAYPGPVLNLLLLGQNYHLIHHLWTAIPWYRYQAAFHEVNAELVERGAPIGWRSRAETPSDLASRRARA